MLHKKIFLTENKHAYLVTYIHEHYKQDWEDVGDWVPKKRPAVLLLPGGGYAYCSEREGEPTVYPFLCAGYDAFYLVYRTDEESVFPNPLEDIANAVWEIRKNAEGWGIDPEKIAVGGFSAGGSLTSILGTQWHRGSFEKRLGIPEGGSKPNAMVLCYTPVEMKETVKNSKVGAILQKLPLEVNSVNFVDKNTPPTFIWHTMEDEKVPVINAIKFAEKCLEYGVPFELHIFEKGQHGLSLNTDLTAYKLSHPVNVDKWVPMCINWLNNLFHF
ncbi:MAG: alpha/beta hydrolase [Anaerolineaceae bacterium]|nr:alpha/beta hydrolase [Anaerolineaceae bacterium]